MTRRIWPHNDRGGVSVEFALTLPVVVVVLALVVGGIALASHRLGLIAAAYEIAALTARGDVALAESVVARLPEGTQFARESHGELTCIELSSRPGIGPLRALTVSGRACAAHHGGAAG